MNTLQAFHNDEAFKKKLVTLAVKHREQDQYIKGEYGRMNGKFKGCSVGCLIYDINQMKGTDSGYGDHAFLSDQLGVPEFICRLQDTIFENLPSPLNTEWTERLVSAIPVGKDLSLVLPNFLLRTLDNLPETDRKDVVDSIKGVKEVLQNWADTGAVDVDAARSAESAAWSAARSAAWSAEWAARSAACSAESAACSAAWSAARSAAWSAAWSAARSAAWSAACSAAWEQRANDLIECIEAA